MNRRTTFILNDSEVSTSAPSGTSVLDFLREDRRLTGTKEGCREGECGACVVLIGVLRDRRISYRAVTSCLVPLGELHRKHLVTIEGLNVDRLSAVQQAIVDEGASQCGFCTPGIVVSLTGHLMERRAAVDSASIKSVLGGHICRCTGYRSLKACATRLEDAPRGVEGLVGRGELPAWFLNISDRLAALPDPEPAGPRPPNGFVVAGGTDLYVQKGDELAVSDVLVLNDLAGPRGIRDTGTEVQLDPATTFAELAKSPVFRGLVPEIRRYMDEVASVQIRNRATVGGNLANASPIGDVTILLLALDTTLTLRSASGRTRQVRLDAFYLGYKRLDRSADELIERITIRKPRPGTKISWEKVSRRRFLDVASVNSTLAVRVDDGVIAEAVLTCGGVAPIPLLLRRTSDALTGWPLTIGTLQAAARVAQTEIAPISDVRGSAGYKRFLVRQLLLAHFNKLYPESIPIEALDEEY